MATVAVALAERRHERRVAGGGPHFSANAVLRPGKPVTLLNISGRSALVQSIARLRPGAHTELQLSGAGARAAVKGRIERCYVAHLDPVRYHGVVVFDERLEVGVDQQGSE
jgi:hypothetical protein